MVNKMRRLDVEATRQKLAACKTGRSQWRKAKVRYASELLDGYEDTQRYADSHSKPEAAEFLHYDGFRDILLNGASSWRHASESGSLLVGDYEILERTTAPSMLGRMWRKCERGEIDTMEIQARCAAQAARLLYNIGVKINAKSE